ncbi:MAG: glycerol-3-phosphate 1-O-acyltransferase PlsY [Candidatus Eisenbacteria bacterium]
MDKTLDARIVKTIAPPGTVAISPAAAGTAAPVAAAVAATGPLGLALLAFLVGSVPFGALFARIRRIDIRSHGSGNPGATNVLRVMGLGWGLATLLLDIGKGWLAAGPLVWWSGAHEATASLGPLLAGLCVVAGHLYSPWMRFRGGKGVAAAVGCYLAISPAAALLAAALFVLVVAATRIVSLGSLAMVAGFPPAVLLLGSTTPTLQTAAWGAVLALWIGWRHRANLIRVAHGTESRIGGRRR